MQREIEIQNLIQSEIVNKRLIKDSQNNINPDKSKIINSTNIIQDDSKLMTTDDNGNDL